ncbi:S9 family peptidase [Candidatus Chloroploca sp. Khr17]|uniref:alpha/beta hydrolase family protein n=1 Tax=Candidatus Chloroploca sp. Khr17 TaxID=2496869 RepID=UPI00101B7103|nr:CocE/NonD family hydrolase [Candidatus Chloroploca sp. Khr17]
MRRWLGLLLLVVMLVGCTAPAPSEQASVPTLQPTPLPTANAQARREISFPAADGTLLAGELALPAGSPPYPLVVIIHHSGPVDRTAYAYMEPLLLARGYAVFRFDKRGTGASAGTYGCCESDDALAAYQAVTSEAEINRDYLFIAAQSLGTYNVAEQFAAYQTIAPPRGVALLSNLLDQAMIVAIEAPIHVIVADSEPELNRIGPEAVAAHQAALPYGASLYVAEGAEHTLFDLTAGPIDWQDPGWAERYHRGAMASLLDWLDHQRVPLRA